MSTDKPFTQIPIIDFGPFLNGSTTDQHRVANEIGNASRNVGFFYLINHGLPQSLLDRVFAQSKRFFAMPLKEKMKLRKPHSDFVTGYNELYREKVSRLGDYKEAFDFMRELPPNDEYLKMKGAEVYSGNVWPENLHGFRETVYDEYLNAVVQVADKVMESYALALNLPIDWFKPLTRKPIVLVRLAHYPAPDHSLTDEQLSCGAHTDQFGVTLLAQQDDVCGLQVKNSVGEWIDAVPVPGALVVNIGDLIERWSNGHFKATEHRVIMQRGIERYSAVAFYMPDYHTKIECCIKDEKPKYAPIIAGDFLLKRESVYYGPSAEWVNHEQNIRNTEEHFKTVANSD